MSIMIRRAEALILTLFVGAAACQEFDVASVKSSKSNDPPYANFPLGPGDVYVPNGGLFSAKNFPLLTYIVFAYKIKGNQVQYLLTQLPTWVTSERFDIQARPEGNPGKDQMRLMMKFLLADRFKLAVHDEAREVSVLAFVLSKQGQTGSQLQPHPVDSQCETNDAPSSASAFAQVPLPTQTIAGGLPALCNGIFGMPTSAPGRLRFAGRNVTIAFIADSLSATTNLRRPMIDQTGLTGTFDFSLEWAREIPRPVQPGVDAPPPDLEGPSFEEALQQQLGIKLRSQKSTMNLLVVDHVEHPSKN
jgi:uncharacterized protein (TIGR03435 family)